MSSRYSVLRLGAAAIAAILLIGLAFFMMGKYSEGLPDETWNEEMAAVLKQEQQNAGTDTASGSAEPADKPAPSAAGSGSPAEAAPVREAAPGPADSGRIDLNKATKEQLIGLPGIGPSKAQAILDYRSRNGNFRKTEELVNVKGIGEKTFEKLKDRITVAE